MLNNDCVLYLIGVGIGTGIGVAGVGIGVAGVGIAVAGESNLCKNQKVSSSEN